MNHWPREVYQAFWASSYTPLKAINTVSFKSKPSQATLHTQKQNLQCLLTVRETWGVCRGVKHSDPDTAPCCSQST